MQTAKTLSLYDRLAALPDGLTGEILNGQLHTHPRPAGPHALAESNLQIELGGPFGKGRGGPGGWWIIVEPEVHFVLDTEVAVPDLAGWKRERMPQVPPGHRFEVVPDWICEILSPSTESKDRRIKMPLYAHYGVRFAWLIDPISKTLEAFQLDGKTWKAVGKWHGSESVAAPPFDSVPLNLNDLWS